MSATFLSLPTSIFIHIWNYCGANEIMALASTCRTLNSDIESFMLVINAEQGCYQSEMIPIFFPDQCHSVFISCESSFFDTTFTLSSEKRKTKNGCGWIVWEREVFESHSCPVAFRSDPSREYQVCDDRDEPDEDTGESPTPTFAIGLRKQFMPSAVTPAMKRASSVGLGMGCLKRRVWCPIREDPLQEREMTRFFIKLFLLGCGSLAQESSPIRKCFESGEIGIDEDDTSIYVIPQIINLFEQILEQKEPNDCVKRPLSIEKMERDSNSPAMDLGKRGSGTVRLPNLYLHPEFTWNSCKRRHVDQDEEVLFNNELEFIARIPLAPNTTSIALEGNTRSDSPTLFVAIFFQKRQSDLEYLENPIDGKVFNFRTGFWGLYENTFDVKPEYETCFLYFVHGDATRMELTRLEVCLKVRKDDHIEDLEYWMDVLVHGCCASPRTSDYQRYLPIILLRDGALALQGPDQEQNIELKNAFDMHGLDSSPEGLALILDVCNVLLLVS